MITSQAFHSRLKGLDTELKAILDYEIIDQTEVDNLQSSIDSLDNDSKNLESPHRYKLYEIQAYVLFLKDRLNDAEGCINVAIQLRGRSYYDAEILLKFISEKRESLTSMLVENIKMHGRNEALKGLGWFLLASLVTYISYAHAATAAAKSTDGTGTYYVFWGAMLFGGVALIRGIGIYISSYRRAEDILEKIQ